MAIRKITTSTVRSPNGWLVKICTQDEIGYEEHRAYHRAASLHEAVTVRITLQKDLTRHGLDVINATDYPLIHKHRGRRQVYWA